MRLWVRGAASMRAATYIRVSTRKQEVEAQRDAVVRRAAAEGWPVVLQVEDEGRSGRTDRDAHEAYVRAGERREYDVALYSKISRAHRNLRHFVRDWQRLTGAGIRIVYAMDGLDSSGPFATGIATIMAELAEMESRRHGELMHDRAVLKRGRAASLGQRALWGRKHVDGTSGHLATETDRLIVISLRAEGLSLRVIAAGMGLGKSTVAKLSKSPPIPQGDAPPIEEA